MASLYNSTFYCIEQKYVAIYIVAFLWFIHFQASYRNQSDRSVLSYANRAPQHSSRRTSSIIDQLRRSVEFFGAIEKLTPRGM